MSSLGDDRPYQGVAGSMVSSLGLASVRALHQFPDVRQNVEGTEQCQYPLTVPMLTAKVTSYHMEGKEDARGKEAASFPCRSKAPTTGPR